MGLTASIYANKEPGYENCSNNGISSFFNQVCIMNAEGPSSPRSGCPAVIIQSHVPGIVRAVPAELKDGEWVEFKFEHCVGPMSGGAFIHTSDSRFGELIEKLTGARFYGAVALHDRYESTEDYERLSR
jgi:hypothetical protein